MLIVLVLPAIMMIGALLLERLEHTVFRPSNPPAPRMSTSDTDANG